MQRCCPLCGSRSFYIETPAGLLFFDVNTDANPVNMRPSEHAQAFDITSRIHCTGCSWTGKLQDTKALELER